MQKAPAILVLFFIFGCQTDAFFTLTQIFYNLRCLFKIL